MLDLRSQLKGADIADPNADDLPVSSAERKLSTQSNDITGRFG